MDKLVLNTATKQHIDAFCSRPGHALIIEGLPGSGKRSIAENIIERLLGANTTYLYDYPNDGSGTISIEVIRDVESHLTLKIPNANAINRVVLLENAQNMSLEAQNSLLKNLEEPPRGTLIILTVANAQSLLPTILSRSAKMSVTNPPIAVTKDYFVAKGLSAKAVDSAIMTSGGLVGLMTALLNDEDHPLIKATQTARDLLTQSRYERLITSEVLIKDKTLLLNVLRILQQMAHVRIMADGSNTITWGAIMKQSYQATEEIQKNGQPKLVVDRLLLNL